MNKFILFIPIALIIIIVIFLSIFLLQNKNPNRPPSALINEDVPIINLTNLFDEDESILTSNLKNKMTLINFFASWCIPCKAEHPIFFEIKKLYPELFILGINMQDKKNDALKFLNTDGNPYDYVGIDKKGLSGIEFGVVGLPETFLVNNSGKIIYKFLGPVTNKIFINEILPLLN